MAFALSIFLVISGVMGSACSTSHSAHPGPIDQHETEKALWAHRREFRGCHKAYAPKESGVVETFFAIEKDGRARTASIRKSTFSNPAVGSCLLAVIKKIQFPLPNIGKPVQVLYPFTFRGNAGVK